MGKAAAFLDLFPSHSAFITCTLIYMLSEVFNH